MARIKHIALHTEDPSKTAEFYKEVFGLDELRREPRDTGAEGVWLTDGYIYFAILKMGSEDAPNLGEGPSTVKGIHHIGFKVDDLDEACDRLEKAKGRAITTREGMDTMAPGSPRNFEMKWSGPDDVVIDISHTGWLTSE